MAISLCAIDTSRLSTFTARPAFNIPSGTGLLVISLGLRLYGCECLKVASGLDLDSDKLAVLSRDHFLPDHDIRVRGRIRSACCPACGILDLDPGGNSIDRGLSHNVVDGAEHLDDSGCSPFDIGSAA